MSRRDGAIVAWHEVPGTSPDAGPLADADPDHKSRTTVICPSGRSGRRLACKNHQNLTKSAGTIGMFSSGKTELDLFRSVPGQRKRGDLVLAHELDSRCFHGGLRFASQQAAKYK